MFESSVGIGMWALMLSYTSLMVPMAIIAYVFIAKQLNLVLLSPRPRKDTVIKTVFMLVGVVTGIVLFASYGFDLIVSLLLVDDTTMEIYDTLYQYSHKAVSISLAIVSLGVAGVLDFYFLSKI